MVSPAQLAWIESALTQDTKANPPVPRLTIAQRAELRALMDAGHVDDVLIEIKYHSHVAFGRVMEKTMQRSRELRQRAATERLQRAQLAVLTKLMADKAPTPEPPAPPVAIDQTESRPNVTTPNPTPAPQTVPVVAVGASQTKEKRQDRRLKLCEDAGLVMPKSHLSRLPDGVGNIARHEGVTRQALSIDVKAALKRRESAIREGETVSST